MRWLDREDWKGVTQMCLVTPGYFWHKSRLVFMWGVTCVWLCPCSCLLVSLVSLAVNASHLNRMRSCSEEGRGGGEMVQPCWSNVHLDSWYFSQCFHFKTIHHAQGITSRHWIAELAPWEAFSCENWLGRTALPHEENCFDFLIFKRQGKHKSLTCLTGNFSC